MTHFDRPWLERDEATHPLAGQVAGRTVALGVSGDTEVARIVLAAYRVESARGRWDPEAGRTTLDRATVARAAELGQLLAHAGMADGRGIAPGPVVTFTGASLLLDLRFGDPDEDARAVEAIVQAFFFEELDLTLSEDAPDGTVVSGGS